MKRTLFVTLLLAGLLAVGLSPAEAAAEAEKTVFDGKIYQSIAAILIFLTLFVVLYKFAWSRILTGLQERERKIREDLAEAERAATQAQETLREYNQQLAAAHEESRRVIEQGRAEAEKIAAQVQARAQRDLERARDRAGQEIRAAREEAVASLYAETGALATAVAGRILAREIRPEDQQALIEQSLEELKQAQAVESP